MSPRTLAILVVVSLALLAAGPAIAQDEGTAKGDSAADGAKPAEEGANDDADKADEADDKDANAGDFSSHGGEFGSEWGPVTLEITGNKVKGSWKEGTFTGYIDENGVMFYEWTQHDGVTGKGTFMWDKNRWVGRWGYEASATNGGDWTLYRPKKK